MIARHARSVAVDVGVAPVGVLDAHEPAFGVVAELEQLGPAAPSTVRRCRPLASKIHTSLPSSDATAVSPNATSGRIASMRRSALLP